MHNGDMVNIKVLFFARSREVTGVSEESFGLSEPADSRALLAALLAKYPQLESVMKTCVLALNQEYVGAGEVVPLSESDEVAVIPPLSGG